MTAMRTTTPAPAFPFNHRTIAGPVTDSLATAKDNAWGFAIATITTVRYRGTGDSLRATIGLTASNGAIAVATIDADRLRQIPDFLRTPGARVQVRGTVRRVSSMTVIEVVGIAPPPAD